MNIENLLFKGLKGIIVGGISVADFHAVTNFDEPTCNKILDFLNDNQIGTFDGSLYQFEKGDKLKIAMIQIGRAHV